MVLLDGPVLADGAAGASRGGTPGAGGVDVPTGSGNQGTDGVTVGGGGGGGAGTTGGSGGMSGAGNAGGLGGLSGGNLSRDGTAGADGLNDGGGGGGGAHGYVGLALPAVQSTGGNGGAGGSVSQRLTSEGPGGGGAGGYGAVITGTGLMGALGAAVTAGYGGKGGTAPIMGADGGSGGIGLLLTNTVGPTVSLGANVSGGRGGDGGSVLLWRANFLPAGNGAAGGIGAQVNGIGASIATSAGVTVRGGDGGTGGNGNANISTGGNGGAGGNAGAGMVFAAGSSILLNSGTITGGNGGAPGNHGHTAGLGGTGLVGSDLIIVNGGAINGGFANAGSGVQANAITFTGGDNYLNLNSGGAAGTLSGNIAVTGTLTFNQTYAVTLSNAITGAGSIIQDGPGALILSGSSSYTGATTVNGRLEVDGSVAASSGVTVNSGGTLAGTGTVSSTTVNSGGTLLAGNGTAGTSLAISGNLAFQSGAIYLVALNPATASFVNVTGTATLGNATVNAGFAPGGYVSRQYTILTAGSISGTFGSLVNTNLPSGFTASLSNDATHAYLNLALSYTPPPAPSFAPGLRGNQQVVGNSLVNFFNTTGSIPLVFGTLTPTGLAQISGEGAAGSQQTTFNAMNQLMGVMTDPFIAGRGDPDSGAGANSFADDSMAYAASGQGRTGSERDAYAAVSYAAMSSAAMSAKAPPAQTLDARWSVWAAGFGGSQSTDGNGAAGSNNTTSRIYGTAVGADYRFSPNTVAGFALAGGGTNFGVNGLGAGRSDLFQVGAHVRHVNGPSYILAALAYGWQDVSTDRTVTVAGLDRLHAEFNASAYSGRVEGGYRFVTPWMSGIGLTPYAAAQVTTFDLPAYTESVVAGAGTFALAYAGKRVTDTRSELGLRTDKSFAMADGILTLRGRLAWAHDFNPDRSIAATFQVLPGASFVVNGAAQASDSALVTASAEKKWLNGWAVAATFEGEFSDVTRSYAGKGVVRHQW